MNRQELIAACTQALDPIIPNSDGVLWEYQYDDGQREPVTLSAVVQAILPLIEADLRERIAGEIEAHKQATYDDGSRYIQGALIALDRAARIVREGKP